MALMANPIGEVRCSMRYLELKSCPCEESTPLTHTPLTHTHTHTYIHTALRTHARQPLPLRARHKLRHTSSCVLSRPLARSFSMARPLYAQGHTLHILDSSMCVPHGFNWTIWNCTQDTRLQDIFSTPGPREPGKRTRRCLEPGLTRSCAQRAVKTDRPGPGPGPAPCRLQITTRSELLNNSAPVSEHNNGNNRHSQSGATRFEQPVEPTRPPPKMLPPFHRIKS